MRKRWKNRVIIRSLWPKLNLIWLWFNLWVELKIVTHRSSQSHNFWSDLICRSIQVNIYTILNTWVSFWASTWRFLLEIHIKYTIYSMCGLSRLTLTQLWPDSVHRLSWQFGCDLICEPGWVRKVWSDLTWWSLYKWTTVFIINCITFRHFFNI